MSIQQQRGGRRTSEGDRSNVSSGKGHIERDREENYGLSEPI